MRPAECAVALCLLNDDLLAFGVDLQIIVAFDLQLTAQFFRQNETSQAVYTAHNSRIFHFQMFLSVLTVLHEIRILTDDVAFYRDSLPHMYAAADGSKKCTFISIVKAGNIP